MPIAYPLPKFTDFNAQNLHFFSELTPTIPRIFTVVPSAKFLPWNCKKSLSKLFDCKRERNLAKWQQVNDLLWPKSSMFDS